MASRNFFEYNEYAFTIQHLSAVGEKVFRFAAPSKSSSEKWIGENWHHVNRTRSINGWPVRWPLLWMSYYVVLRRLSAMRLKAMKLSLDRIIWTVSTFSIYISTTWPEYLWPRVHAFWDSRHFWRFSLERIKIVSKGNRNTKFPNQLQR